MGNLNSLTPFKTKWVPILIANCVLWLDSTDNATITLSSGKVSQWNDKSGRGNNATQATAARQFTPQAASINGLQTLQTPTIAALSHTGMECTLVGGSLTTFTYCVLLKANSNPVGVTILGSETNTGDITLETGQSDTTKLDTWINNVGEGSATATAAFPNATACWVVYTYSTPNMNIYVNNVQKLTNGTTNTTSRQLNSAISICGNTIVGGFDQFRGQIGDALLFSRVLNGTEIGNTYTKYAKPKWGLP